jgi:protocatechuate 3,4-dioxygenase beta subunit
MEIGRRVGRRGFLVSTAASVGWWKICSAAELLGLQANSPVCALAAEQEVGPYYVAEELVRTDIREGKPGVPLTLRLAVMDLRSCKPLPRAAIDIWHCDPLGVYAGFTKINPTGMGGPGGPCRPPLGMPGQNGESGPPPGPPAGDFDPQHPGRPEGPPEGVGFPPAMKATDQMTFLRGIQFTGSDGIATFETVFPGFYMGRTNHIHFKVRESGKVVKRKGGAQGDQTYIEGHTAHTGQVFFPEEFAAELMKHEPYSLHKIHRVTQAEDFVFGEQHGEPSVAKLRPADNQRSNGGYTADLIVAVDPSATPTPAHMGPPGQRRS